MTVLVRATLKSNMKTHYMERKNSLEALQIKRKYYRTEKVTEGKSGNNLMLTVDMELQKK